MTTRLQSDRIRVMVRLLDNDPTLALSRRRMAQAMRLTPGQFDYLVNPKQCPEGADIWKAARARAVAASHQTRRCQICGITSQIEDFANDKTRPAGKSYRHRWCNRLMVAAYRAGQ